MTGPEAQAAYLAFQRGPTVAELSRALPDLGDHTAAVLAELSLEPTLPMCDRALCQLAGASELVRRLRSSLAQEGADGQ